MTAIAGSWRSDGNPRAAQDCASMLVSQAVYGPHGSAQWDGGFVALGRNLFEILPEDVHDSGPVISADSRYVMVADVRLDNRDDLIAELMVGDARAKRLPDTAILLAAFLRWDENCVDHLVGDFAFALWDQRQRRLLLARDFLGQRPLHYHRGSVFFAFASMPKGLHALPDIPREPDEERAAEFLAGIPEYGSQSFFRGVERVEAGHIVTVTEKNLAVRRHWNPQRHTLAFPNPDDYVEAFRHHLDQATRVRLRGANGAVGAHLSGGFDSSSVAATAARIIAPGKVVAFTAVPREGYDGPPPRGRFGDEGPLAAATAALYPNMEHVRVHTRTDTVFDGLDRYYFLFERPVLNLCNQVWSRGIAEAAQARGLKIMLTGAMGNMSISADQRIALAEYIVRGKWLSWMAEARGLVRNRYRRWPGILASTFGPWMPRPLWVWLNRRFGGQGADIGDYSAIRPDRFAQLDLDARARRHGLDVTYRPWKNAFDARVWVLRRVDLGNYNKGFLAGWGIDLRDPTADRRLVEFTLALPMNQLLANGIPRPLARRALADRLPQDVLAERRKGYQAIDWHEGLTAARGFAAEEIERIANNDPAAKALDTARMRAWLDNWPAGGWEQKKIMQTYRLALLRGISLGHFLRKASGGNM